MKQIDINNSSLPFSYIYIRDDDHNPIKKEVIQVKKYHKHNSLPLNDSTNSFIADWQLIEVKLSNMVVIKTEINYDEYR